MKRKKKGTESTGVRTLLDSVSERITRLMDDVS